MAATTTGTALNDNYVLVATASLRAVARANGNVATLCFVPTAGAAPANSADGLTIGCGEIQDMWLFGSAVDIYAKGDVGSKLELFSNTV